MLDKDITIKSTIKYTEKLQMMCVHNTEDWTMAVANNMVLKTARPRQQ